ncbi:MAG: DUF368 domain-containing protein [Bacilli bacterium]|nr:DUF368 domain-containing protein [Bacilli bacterium]
MDLVIKGFIIGVGKIIPGVSGAMLAISLGIYETLLNKVVNLRRNFFDSIFYLGKVGFGVVLSIIVTSKIIVKCLDSYYFLTMLLFIGMIIGGIKDVVCEIKFNKFNVFFGLGIFLIFIILSFFSTPVVVHNVNYSFLFFLSMIGIGFLDAFTSIVPGISGTAILISLGYYNIVLDMFGSILDFSLIFKNLFLVVPFSIGLGLGLFIVSYVLNFLFKHYKNITYFVILILILIITFSLFKNTLVYFGGFVDVFVGIPLFILGFIISFKLGNK